MENKVNEFLRLKLGVSNQKKAEKILALPEINQIMEETVDDFYTFYCEQLEIHGDSFLDEQLGDKTFWAISSEFGENCVTQLNEWLFVNNIQ